MHGCACESAPEPSFVCCVCKRTIGTSDAARVWPRAILLYTHFLPPYIIPSARREKTRGCFSRRDPRRILRERHTGNRAEHPALCLVPARIYPRRSSGGCQELRKLTRKPPDGIKYIPNDDDKIGEIHAEIEGPPQHLTRVGRSIKLVLGQDFPNSPPKGFSHPNIPSQHCQNGDICQYLKRDWKPSMGISHVLQVIRCLLIVPFPESSLNDEAGKMFMESYDDYAERARLMTRIHALKKIDGKSSAVAPSAPATPGSSAAAPGEADVNAENQGSCR